MQRNWQTYIGSPHRTWGFYSLLSGTCSATAIVMEMLRWEDRCFYSLLSGTCSATSRMRSAHTGTRFLFAAERDVQRNLWCGDGIRLYGRFLFAAERDVQRNRMGSSTSTGEAVSIRC